VKVKLGIVFVVVGTASLLAVYYLKYYLSYETFRTPQKIVEVDVPGAFKGASGTLFDFSGSGLKGLAGEDYFGGDAFFRELGARTLVLHFWASWCEPCIIEIPELVHFSKAEGHKDRYLVAAISMDYTVEDLQKFLKSFPEIGAPPFAQIWDKDNSLAKGLGVEKLPATVVYKNGRFLQRMDGVVDWKRFPH
jgi:thiol-disulfide isomerase/thioredoxin